MTNTITKITYDWDDYKVWAEYTAGTWISITSNEIANTWVTSFNWNTWTVTYTAPVTSVNGSTWAVTVSAVPAVWTNGQVLTVVSWAAAWANASGWDVKVSSQAHNLLTTGMKIWCGTEWDYANLGTYDMNSLYLTVPWGATPWGWTPWANTVAYYPLTSVSTVDDESGNNRDLTNSWIIFGDYWWVDCGYFDGSVYASFSWFSLDNSARTVNFWAYCTWSVWGYYAVAHISDFSAHPSWSLWVKFNNWNTNVWPWDWVNASAETVTATVTAWWHNIVVVQESTAVKLYVDGTLIGTNSSYPSESWTPSGWSVGSKNASTHSERFIGYVSNLILEDKVWTATEVADYFDQTKSTYWIS